VSVFAQKPALYSIDGHDLAALDSLPLILWLTDERGRCVFANKAALAYTGQSANSDCTVGHADNAPDKWLKNLHPDDVQHVKRGVAKRLSTPGEWQTEYRLRRADGEYRWFLATMSPISDEGGNCTGYLGSAADITRRRAAFESLHTSEARYRRLYDSNLIGVTFTALGGPIIDANRAFLDIVGYSREDLLAGRMNWIDLTPVEYREVMVQRMREIQAAGIFPPYEKEYFRKDGTRVPVLVASSLLEGSQTDCVTYVIDLSAQKQAERILRQTASELEERVRERTARLATMNEELKRSEERYRRIVETSGEGIWVLDADDKTVFVNQRMADMLGYRPEEMIGEQLLSFFDERRGALAKAAMERRHMGASETSDVKFRRKDGSELWTLVAGTPFFNERGRYTGALGMVTDIADRKEAEELARAQTAALNRTLSLVATEPSLDTVLSHVLKAITEQLNVASSALYLHDLDKNVTSLHMSYDRGRVLKGDELDDPLRFDATHVQRFSAHWRAQKGNVPPAVVDVASSRELEERTSKWFLTHKVRTLLLVPLAMQHELMGTLSVRIAEQRLPKAAEIELAQALAQQASLAVQLTRLAETARRVAVLEERNRATTERATELGRANGALKHTLDVLATEKNIDEVLGHVLAVSTQVLGGCGSLLWLRDFQANSTRLHLFYQNDKLMSGDESLHRLAGQDVSLERMDLFVLTVFRVTHPIWHEVNTSTALSQAAREYLKREGVKGLLGVPLILGDQTIGVIIVRFAQVRHFGSLELELAQGLAQQATLALQLTRLAEQARKAAVTEERNRMAREIHDALAQGFTGILIQLQAAEQVLNGAHPELKSHLDSAISLARQGLAEARRSVLALRPQLLQGGDIASALNRLVRSTSGDSIRVVLSVAGDPQPLAPEIESNVFRIAQEAITNAVKHSGGSRVHVWLNIDSDGVKIQVEDDGRGFDLQMSALSRGFGLLSMQERAERIGGALTIHTMPGAGTKVHLVVPQGHREE
jgi:PAS domain S-box-containing protein